jgi:hypothetical protein
MYRRPPTSAPFVPQDAAEHCTFRSDVVIPKAYRAPMTEPPTTTKHVLVLRCRNGLSRNLLAECVRQAVRRLCPAAPAIDFATENAVADAIASWAPAVASDLAVVAADLGEVAEVVGGYAVDEVVQWDDAPGAPSSYTMVAFTRRRPDLPREQFVQRYLAHAILARRHHPGVRRYTQGFVTEVLPGSRDCDAIARLHFADATAFAERLYRDAESRRIIADDVAGFLDRPRIWTVFTAG